MVNLFTGFGAGGIGGAGGNAGFAMTGAGAASDFAFGGSSRMTGRPRAGVWVGVAMASGDAVASAVCTT